MARGYKTGGRQKGSVNKVTQIAREKIIASGLTPLEYMLGILRNPESTKDEKFAAAKEAAPYVHAKLSSIEGNMNVRVSHEDTLTELETAAQIEVSEQPSDAAYH